MIKGGFLGRILRVDLDSQEMSEEALDEGILRKFVGQEGIGAKIMYDEVPSEIKADDPENRIIFMTGPLTGTGVQSPSNFQVITQNPITGSNIAIANSHGFWGANLKLAGYDGLVIKGVSEKPAYLWIHDGEYEIRDATKFWGKSDTFETETLIKKEIDLERVSVIAIGPAGEHLCAGSCLENDHGHIAAKGNPGIVMGLKRLKAIAVHGSGRVPVADAERFRELAKQWREESFRTSIGSMVNAYGTAGYIPSIHELGDLPIKNFLTGVFPDYEKLSGQYIRKKFKLKRNPCFGCTLAHCHIVEVTEGPYSGFQAEEPEYEAFACLGSEIWVSDPGAVMWLTDYVDRLGLDANWAGAIIGWAMEAYERGILHEKNTKGLKLRWGDEKAAAELLRRIAYREDIGEVLALGLKKGPEKIGGKEAVAFSVHFKGETHHGHDARALWGDFLGLCISNGGPRWESPGADLIADADLGYPNGLAPFDLKDKPEAARKTQLKRVFGNTLGVCRFAFVGMDTMVKAYSALTGWPLTIEEAFRAAERIVNVERAFNVKHGFKPEFDLDVSPRLLEAPPDGAAKGKSIAPYLEDLIKEYTRLMDWDWMTGKPSRNKLSELGLDDVAKDLWG